MVAGPKDATTAAPHAPQLLVTPRQRQQQQQASQTLHATQQHDLSPTMSVVLVYVTHGLMNAALLSPWNPVRCAYFQTTAAEAAAPATCSGAEDWMLNWLAFGLLHVHLLLACLAYTAVHNTILEQRLLTMVVAVMVSSLSGGVHMLRHLNRPMAALQAAIHVGMLLRIAHLQAVQHAAATAAVPFYTVAELRNASFDARRKLPVSTIAVCLQFFLAAFRVLDMTFGDGTTAGYMDGNGSIIGASFITDTTADTCNSNSSCGSSGSSTAVVDVMSNAAVTCMLWVALILGVCVVAATAAQQKVLLAGHALALFVSMLLLTSAAAAAAASGSANGAGMSVEEESQRHTAGLVGTFAALILALIGAY